MGRIVGLVLGMAGLVVGSAVPAAALDNGWIEMAEVPAPTVGNVAFEDVVIPARGTAIAVGHRFSTLAGFFQFQTWIQRYDGTQWSLMPSPPEREPFRSFLYSVDAAGASDVWAVGRDIPVNGLGQPIAEHFDGTSWSVSPTPHPGLKSGLAGVSVRRSDDVWAVGDKVPTGSFYDVPFVLRWDGTAWTESPFPADPVPGCNNHQYLTDVAAVPGSTSVFAVGNCGSGTGQGFVAQWTPRRGWRVVRAPIPAGASLQAVHARSSSDVWAVGSLVPSAGQQRNFVLHYDGTTWTEVAVPSTGEVSGLNAVVTVGANEVWAVGAGDSPQPPFAGPVALHFDGTQWTEVPPGGFGNLLGVTGRGNKVYAVGLRIDEGLILTR